MIVDFSDMLLLIVAAFAGSMLTAAYFAWVFGDVLTEAVRWAKERRTKRFEAEEARVCGLHNAKSSATCDQGPNVREVVDGTDW